MVHLFFLLVWFGCWVHKWMGYAKLGKNIDVLFNTRIVQNWAQDAGALYTPRFGNHIQTRTSMGGPITRKVVVP